jgi:hypothetical protein
MTVQFGFVPATSKFRAHQCVLAALGDFRHFDEGSVKNSAKGCFSSFFGIDEMCFQTNKPKH